MSSKSALRRALGLLGSWALFVLGAGLACIGVAGQWINVEDSQKLRRYGVIQALLEERTSGRAEGMRRAKGRSESSQTATRSRMATAADTISRTRVKGRSVSFPASGALPDDYFVEMARKHGLSVIRLGPGQAIDAETGLAARQIGGGVWDWIGSARTRRMLAVVNNTVVEVSNGTKRELPPGSLIRAGDTLVIPPLGSPQRSFDKTPVNFDAPAKAPIAKPAEPVSLPIVSKPRASRGARLREAGESIFGGAKNER